MITLSQVKADIITGKVKKIFYSTGNCWWTHLETDLLKAREIGHKASDERFEAMMKDPTVPQSHKERMKALKEVANSGVIQTPLDPTGCPLYEMSDPNKWISGSEEKPTHFGRHGMKAFMLSHHQNSRLSDLHVSESMQWNIFDGWEGYNRILDKYPDLIIL